MLLFKNPGLIDLRAATTIGVNVKEGETPIGFFGSGLKYAIAGILRLGGAITVYRGYESHVFTAKRVDIRGKEFDIVCMNGVELGFTTSYGKTWEPWQFYRELFTNAQDEGGEVYESTEIEACDDMTIVAVDCEQLSAAHQARADFILQGSPIFDGAAAAIHDGARQAIFYQNLKVSSPPVPCLYTYNMRHKVDLTEDRTLKNSFEFDRMLSRITDELCNSADHRHHEMAKRIMLAPEESWERQACFHLPGSGERSEKFFAMAEHLARHHLTQLNRTIIDMLTRRRPLLETVETFEPSEFQREVLTLATEFCKTIGFPVDAYPIVCAERLGNGMLGMAHQDTIYITRHVFELGTKMVASTLIEEFIHLREGVADFTRGMQELLLNRMVTLGEEHVWKRPL